MRKDTRITMLPCYHVAMFRIVSYQLMTTPVEECNEWRRNVYTECS